MDQELEQYDQFFIDIFRSWNTAKELLKDRKYIIPNILENVSTTEFFEMFKNNAFDIVGTHPLTEQKAIVSFVIHRDPKVLSIPRADILKKYPHKSDTQKTKIIWILKAPLNANIKLEENEEAFHYKELIINRTHHRLVPKHELISESEKKDLLQTYDCRDSQLPRILTTDFITRYYGAKPNDIFKITRPSASAGYHIFYRVVK